MTLPSTFQKFNKIALRTCEGKHILFGKQISNLRLLSILKNALNIKLPILFHSFGAIFELPSHKSTMSDIKSVQNLHFIMHHSNNNCSIMITENILLPSEKKTSLYVKTI